MKCFLLWEVFQGFVISFLRLLLQMLTLTPPILWATWQELRSESKANSEAIFSKMLEAKVSEKEIDSQQ